MKLTIYQIDAFAEKPFEGNPAAVVPLDAWLPYQTMQLIAEENNLSETAFFIPTKHGFHIRWFTPKKEVQLCGHATLASAYVLFNILHYKQHSLIFESLSGTLSVSKNNEWFTLNFPAQPPSTCDTPIMLSKGLGKQPLECLKHEDFLAVFEHEEDVLTMTPDHKLLEQLDLRGVIVTAPSSEYDFIVRFFAPKYGIDEDPVTGSAYTQLIPYWSNKLGKRKLNAKQVSVRGGNVFCELIDDRVLITGGAVKYMQGTIEINS
ncbi:MAG: PhzF family phenazine biosynthesis protein [Candidatus Endobugula sp.]|jgi:PhzF family phenazine biosynthesis protein